MAVYKRGDVWWFKFNWCGKPIRESTKTGNKRIAEQIEAARKTALAKGEVGIVERVKAPTFEAFAPRFRAAIENRCGSKPRTVAFYLEKLDRLLEYEPIANARLDKIDEAMIEAYVQKRRKKRAPATVNRQLATLRRALRLAQEWKVIDRVPKIQLLSGERIRDFVLSREQETNYLAILPETLHDVAVLLLDTGLRIGEALSLEWADVHTEPAPGAKFGYVQVREGKSRNARRTVGLTSRARAMLEAREKVVMGPLVFASKSGGPLLGTYMNRLHQKAREALKQPADFVLHSLRHTMLSRLGEAGVDAFTIMRIAGHSSITVSQRYVHPSTEAMERAIEKLDGLNAGGKHGVVTNMGTPATKAPTLPDRNLLQ